LNRVKKGTILIKSVISVTLMTASSLLEQLTTFGHHSSNQNQAWAVKVLKKTFFEKYR